VAEEEGTFRVKEQACPWCWWKLDAATNITEGGSVDPPVSGDVTVCIGCAAVLFFRDDMTLRAGSLSEVDSSIRPRVKKIIEAVRVIRSTPA
jgi:hypothetical protein